MSSVRLVYVQSSVEAKGRRDVSVGGDYLAHDRDDRATLSQRQERACE